MKQQVIKGDYMLPNSRTTRPPRVAYEGSLMAGGGTGGTGYGDVLERNPQSVVADVRNELISDWIARNVYHVAYDAETWIADEEKTKELRDREREDRRIF